ncbi:MAG TPA: lysophospholipase [Thermoanaerobaculia bacterium]|nr:lysophospholipase [Thermoanaerobaculia bacterium]
MPPLESVLQTSDGLTLAGEHHLRPDCRAAVVIVHGYAEHAGRYTEVVSALGEAGYECHLLDLRGHGRSGGVHGYVGRFGEYLDDLDLFLQRVEEVRTPGRPVPRILLGHSLGGLISLSYVLRRPEAFAALAVSSPFLHPAMEVSALKAGLAAVVSRLAPTYLMKSAIGSRWLSHDPAVVAAYNQDPLVFKTLSPHWFFQIREAQEDILQRAGEIRLPALFLIGEADRIADPARSRQVYERLGSAEKQIVVYPGFFHEVLNEIERARVVHDFLTWLGQRTAPPPAR